eukprot:11419646-Alexandrium_andersonii.AAC.1
MCIRDRLPPPGPSELEPLARAVWGWQPPGQVQKTEGSASTRSSPRTWHWSKRVLTTSPLHCRAVLPSARPHSAAVAGKEWTRWPGKAHPLGMPPPRPILEGAIGGSRLDRSDR